MRQILVFLSRFLSEKQTQKMLLQIAKRLAEKTSFKWDDEIIDAFCGIWNDYYMRKNFHDPWCKAKKWNQ